MNFFTYICDFLRVHVREGMHAVPSKIAVAATLRGLRRFFIVNMDVYECVCEGVCVSFEFLPIET